MKEAYITHLEPVFTRTGPLSKGEELLLEHAQEPGNKARYSYHDCQVHGIFKVDNDLGLASVGCPRNRKQCQVREVFDPAGYQEYYSISNPKFHPDPVPAPAPKPAPVQLELPGAGLPPAELKRRMELALGCTITAPPEQLLDAMQLYLSGIAPPERERPAEEEEPEEVDPYAELTDVGLYASQMFSAREVCIMAGLDYEAKRDDPDFLEEFNRGRLLRQSRVRSTILLHAEMGSAPAQAEALKLIRNAAIAAAGSDD